MAYWELILKTKSPISIGLVNVLKTKYLNTDFISIWSRFNPQAVWKVNTFLPGLSITVKSAFVEMLKTLRVIVAVLVCSWQSLSNPDCCICVQLLLVWSRWARWDQSLSQLLCNIWMSCFDGCLQGYCGLLCWCGCLQFL